MSTSNGHRPGAVERPAVPPSVGGDVSADVGTTRYVRSGSGQRTYAEAASFANERLGANEAAIRQTRERLAAERAAKPAEQSSTV